MNGGVRVTSLPGLWEKLDASIISVISNRRICTTARGIPSRVADREVASERDFIALDAI